MLHPIYRAYICTYKFRIWPPLFVTYVSNKSSSNECSYRTHVLVFIDIDSHSACDAPGFVQSVEIIQFFSIFACSEVLHNWITAYKIVQQYNDKIPDNLIFLLCAVCVHVRRVFTSIKCIYVFYFYINTNIVRIWCLFVRCHTGDHINRMDKVFQLKKFAYILEIYL